MKTRPPILTPEQLAEARALVDAASPPPWRLDDGDVLAPDDVDCPRGYNPKNRVADWCGNDAAFIAASRTLVPALLDFVAALTAERDAAIIERDAAVVRALINNSKRRVQIHALHELVDQTDPNDPIGVALTKVGLALQPGTRCSPVEGQVALHLVPTPAQIEALNGDQLLALYCHVMRESAEVFGKYETYVVRGWDGMDGCWTDCTGEIGREEALRVWVKRTDGGTHQISFEEIDYCRIFPGGTRMDWDGSEGREMHR